MFRSRQHNPLVTVIINVLPKEVERSGLQSMTLFILMSRKSS